MAEEFDHLLLMSGGQSSNGHGAVRFNPAASQQVPPPQPIPPSSFVKKSVNMIEVPVLVRDEKRSSCP